MQPDTNKSQTQKQSENIKEDKNKNPAATQAEEDIRQDPDMQPDTSKTADLDEGELARVDNSND